jgi:hypothetical protein
MRRWVLFGVVFVVLAASAARSFLSRPIPVESGRRAEQSGEVRRPAAPAIAAAFSDARPAGSRAARPRRDRPAERAVGEIEATSLERRVALLEARLAAEAAERRRLKERLEETAAQLARLAAGAELPAAALPPADAAPAAPAPGPEGADAAAIDWNTSAMERALTAAGLAPAQAEEIKRRGDELALAEVYLRDQATREGWLDTPRFKEEMAALDAERMPIRDEIGDEAYDRYLFALGQSNRVLVDDVMVQSPAAEVGLRPGDMIVRYGDIRIFAPADLVAETHGGTPGENVRIEVVRNGERFEIDVPRGPLGLRIAATQDDPEAS